MAGSPRTIQAPARLLPVFNLYPGRDSIRMKNPWTLLALLAALPGAYLSFRRSLIRDIKDQMVDPRNPAGVGIDTVRPSYRLLARIFIGKRARWLELFDPTSEVNLAAKADKSDALHIFVWFVLMFAFSFLAWFHSLGR